MKAISAQAAALADMRKSGIQVSIIKHDKIFSCKLFRDDIKTIRAEYSVKHLK